MTAGELCIRRIVTAERDESVVDAARRMLDENVGDLVVVEQFADSVIPIGIVTDRDLTLGVLSRGTPAAFELRVRDVMQTELITAYDDEDATSALAKLDRYKVRRIPVVNHSGVLQGILTLDDLISWIREQLDHAAAVVARQSDSVGPR
jgi:CBS domain-containing protein